MALCTGSWDSSLKVSRDCAPMLRKIAQISKFAGLGVNVRNTESPYIYRLHRRSGQTIYSFCIYLHLSLSICYDLPRTLFSISLLTVPANISPCLHFDPAVVLWTSKSISSLHPGDVVHHLSTHSRKSPVRPPIVPPNVLVASYLILATFTIHAMLYIAACRTCVLALNHP